LVPAELPTANVVSLTNQACTVVTVPDKQSLSDLLKKQAGNNIHWAACSLVKTLEKEEKKIKWK